MHKFFGVAVLVLACIVGGGVLVAQQGNASYPAWAYGFTSAPPPPGAPAAAPPPAAPAAPAAEDTTPRKVAGSTQSFTLAQIRNPNGPADWFPSDHPSMPDIVAHGKAEQMVLACSLCHYPNGKGRAENAPVSGLPVAYFVQQMHDFKNDLRKSTDPRKANTNRMIGFAKAMTEEEINAAAQYFGAIKWTPWIKVQESATVPKTRIAGGLFLKVEGTETEPIGQRIIEVPENTEDTELLRNPRAGFIAYVPVGAVKKGEALATSGGGKTTQCAVCHGADLLGLGPVPGIAGRSPSYLVRQLYDMQQGSRKGLWTELMKPVVAKLTADDMMNVAAYVASRPVGSETRPSAQ